MTAREGEGKDRIGMEKRGRCRENARGYTRKAPETSKKCRAMKAKRVPRIVMAWCQGLLRVAGIRQAQSHGEDISYLSVLMFKCPAIP